MQFALASKYYFKLMVQITLHASPFEHSIENQGKWENIYK